MIETILGVSPRRYTDIVSVLAQRYVKVRYRGSTLGVLWSVFNPLIMTLLYSAIFGQAFRAYYGGTWLGYAVAVFLGLAVMQFFSTSTSQALQGVVGNGLLLNKMRVPASVFPVATVLASSVQFAIGIVPLSVILAIAIGHNPLGVPLLLIPSCVLFCVAIGIGLLVAAAYVYFRDIPYLWELANFAIFISTPVFYPLAIVPPRFREIIAWNPLTMIIEQMRTIVIRGAVPSLANLVLTFVVGIVLLAGGWLVFQWASRSFMDYL